MVITRAGGSGDRFAAMAASEEITRIAGRVADPELPDLTIADLGILRGVRVDEHDHVDVDLTPTYSGCPAVEVIEHDVRAALAEAGWTDLSVRRVLSPAWTTDWITPEGRRKLAAMGIAPPAFVRGPTGGGTGTSASVRCGDEPANLEAGAPQRVVFVRCPRCGSRDTELLSRFSSTACKALRRCRSCLEPFDHFKPL
jgi:ring-1,2-phenylacetyl-CoA epoxidase subunit PaaD